PAIKHPLVTVPVHNLLVLAGMVAYGLTSDIRTVLLKGLFTLVPLQVLYDLVLLNAIGTPKLTNVPLLVASALLITVVLSVPVFVVLLVFGAPLASHLPETMLLSLHLAVLVFNPLLVVFKIDLHAFTAIFKVTQVYRLIFSNLVLASSFMAIVGTWMGVIPIPLDWDRPWQQWPVTLLFGAYLGTTGGGL
ncbi:PIG-F-domain-containing protein, partial [Suhomyces tanzawaensis NRRL Y-17324]